MYMNMRQEGSFGRDVLCMLADKRLEVNGASEAWNWSAPYEFITCVSLPA